MDHLRDEERHIRQKRPVERVRVNRYREREKTRGVRSGGILMVGV